jgi:hypothetical protein
MQEEAPEVRGDHLELVAGLSQARRESDHWGLSIGPCLSRVQCVVAALAEVVDDRHVVRDLPLAPQFARQADGLRWSGGVEVVVDEAIDLFTANSAGAELDQEAPVAWRERRPSISSARCTLATGWGSQSACSPWGGDERQRLLKIAHRHAISVGRLAVAQTMRTSCVLRLCAAGWSPLPNGTRRRNRTHRLRPRKRPANG